ncbi:hypothetical protein ACU4GR_10245 (plasmid) [Methylobacterium oryzae CBMB20]
MRQRRLHKAFLRYHDPENWPCCARLCGRWAAPISSGRGRTSSCRSRSRREPRQARADQAASHDPCTVRAAASASPRRACRCASDGPARRDLRNAPPGAIRAGGPVSEARIVLARPDRRAGICASSRNPTRRVFGPQQAEPGALGRRLSPLWPAGRRGR